MLRTSRSFERGRMKRYYSTADMPLPFDTDSLELWLGAKNAGSGSTWNDDSGNNHYLPLGETFSWSEGVLSMPGTGYVTLNQNFPVYPVWTIMLMAKPNVVDQAGNIFVRDLSGFNNDVLVGIEPEGGLGGDPSKKWSCDYQDAATGSRTIASSFSDATLSWQTVCATADGSQLKLYINGSLDTTLAKNGDSLQMGSGSGASNIGNDNNRTFNGLVANIILYSKTLSDTEVMNLHNNIFVGI